MDSRVDMDVIGVIEGSDKSSSVSYAWDYLRQYEGLFAPFRRANINLIEVGVEYGPSLKVWEWFFAEAQIVGIDIDPACAALAGGRVVIEIGNQMHGPFMEQVCANYPPTIFIDDGSHKAEHIIACFERVFPKLLPGGLYLIEDMAFHFGPGAHGWQTQRVMDAPGYFSALATECMARRPENRFVRLIDSITFISSGVVIKKRDDQRDLGRALNTADAYLSARKRDANALDRMAQYVLRHRGPPARAEELLDQATELMGPGLVRLILRAEVYLAQGRTPEAVEALLAATACPEEGQAVQHFRLARHLVDQGQAEAALGQARIAVKLAPRNGGFKQLVTTLETQLGVTG